MKNLALTSIGKNLRYNVTIEMKPEDIQTMIIFDWKRKWLFGKLCEIGSN